MNCEEFKYIEVKGTVEEFTEELNEYGKKCWIPIWQKMVEDPENNFYSVWLYRKFNPIVRKKEAEKKIAALMEREEVNLPGAIVATGGI